MVLIVQLSSCFAGPVVAQETEIDLLSSGPVRPSPSYRTESPQGYLMVYSATDSFDDGGVPYYAHSAYSIYQADGRFLKSVENHISRSDEIPTLVMLPVGSYTIEARSETRGYVRMAIVIASERPTIVDPDKAQTNTVKRLVRAKPSRRLARHRSGGSSGSVVSFQF